KNVEKLKRESIKAFEVYKGYEKSINKENSLKIEEQSVKNNIKKIEIEIEKDKKKLVDLDKQINHYDKQLDVINDLIQSIKDSKQINVINEIIKTIKDSNKGLVNKLKAMFSTEEDEQFQKYNLERQQLLAQKLNLEKVKKAKQDDITNNTNKQELLKNTSLKIQNELENVEFKVQEFEAFRKESNITIPCKDFWSNANYDERQISNLWTSDELQYRRAMLFLRA